MSIDPDTDELARRLDRTDDVFEELRKVVGSILDWKSRISGGLTVMVWVVGGVQSGVLVCLGLAANSLNHTAETLGMHAVELAESRTQIESFMTEPRFTAKDHAVEDAEMREWVRQEIKHLQQ